MIEIKRTNVDGTSETMSFSTTTEAARALACLFDVKQAESILRAEQRAALNDEIRAAARRGMSTDDPTQLINQARNF